MMTFFTTQWTGNSIKKYALTDMGLHVSVCRFGIFPCSIAKRALCIKEDNLSFSVTDGTFLSSQLDAL
jgi:hypothetical protein